MPTDSFMKQKSFIIHQKLVQVYGKENLGRVCPDCLGTAEYMGLGHDHYQGAGNPDTPNECIRCHGSGTRDEKPWNTYITDPERLAGLERGQRELKKLRL